MSIEALKARYPWPAQKPPFGEKRHETTGEIFGWFNGQNRHILKRLLADKPPVVLELGALLGLSTRFMAEWGPDTTIITIDHWRGSREHQKFPPLADVLNHLYEVFCVHLWEHRQHVVPMRTTTLAGMVELATFFVVTPSVVYIDASHETGPIYADTVLAMTLWPDAWIVGDDGGWKSIQAAHKDIQRQMERKLINHGCAWQIPPMGREPIGVPK